MSTEARIYHRSGKRDLKVTGELIARINCNRSELGEGETWTELEVIRLANGDWLAARSRAESASPSGRVSETFLVSRPPIVSTDDLLMNPTAETSEVGADLAQERMVLESFGWSWLAKRLADQAGWNYLEYVE
jgi:hypothetical protein